MLSLIINTLFLTKQFAVEFRGNPELHEWYRSLTFSRASVHLNNLYRKRCLGFLVSSRFSSFKWDWARAHEWTFFCNVTNSLEPMTNGPKVNSEQINQPLMENP